MKTDVLGKIGNLGHSKKFLERQEKLKKTQENTKLIQQVCKSARLTPEQKLAHIQKIQGRMTTAPSSQTAKKTAKVASQKGIFATILGYISTLFKRIFHLHS